MHKVILLILLLPLIFRPAVLFAEGTTEMLCMNAGKADAILIRTEGRAYLIDTGYKQTSDRLLTMLGHENITRLDGVFLTHDHKDHCGGLTALVKSNIEIGAFYASKYCISGTDKNHPAVKAASSRGQSVVWLSQGDTVKISETASFSVLGPSRLNTDNENNNSLVMSLVTDDGSILLTGDMKFDEEYDLLKEGVIARHTVLKVPFHGDSSSCSSSFLSAVQPKFGIISTSSAEEKDTPSRETLYRLASVGCTVYVTQNAGDAIRVTLDRGTVTVTQETWD